IVQPTERWLWLNACVTAPARIRTTSAIAAGVAVWTANAAPSATVAGAAGVGGGGLEEGEGRERAVGGVAPLGAAAAHDAAVGQQDGSGMVAPGMGHVRAEQESRSGVLRVEDFCWATVWRHFHPADDQYLAVGQQHRIHLVPSNVHIRQRLPCGRGGGQVDPFRGLQRTALAG